MLPLDAVFAVFLECCNSAVFGKRSMHRFNALMPTNNVQHPGCLTLKPVAYFAAQPFGLTDSQLEFAICSDGVFHQG